MAKSLKHTSVAQMLTNEQVSRALAEWVLVNRGINFTGITKIDATFAFGKDKSSLKGCHVSVTML